MKANPVSLWRRQKSYTIALGIKGKIISFTVIRAAPKLFSKQTPYPVVLVKDAKGNRMIGQFVDYEAADLVIGRQVVSILRKLPTEKQNDIIVYAVKFKPT